MTHEQDLTTAAYRVGCLKGADGFGLVYDPFFRPLRHKPHINILEIGLSAGGPELGGDADRAVSEAPSLALWLDYFPNAHVTGFDISDFGAFTHERFTFVRGDSGSAEDLRKLHDLGLRFDLIIDDGSHASFHQQFMLARLFPLLVEGGLYIIEDLSWQPQEYERTLPATRITSHVLADFFKDGQLAPSSAITAEDACFLESQVAAMFLFDLGYLDMGKRRYLARHGLAYRAPWGGAQWRTKRGLRRLADPYFWRYLTRSIGYAFRAEEPIDRDYMQLAILQRR